MGERQTQFADNRPVTWRKEICGLDVESEFISREGQKQKDNMETSVLKTLLAGAVSAIMIMPLTVSANFVDNGGFENTANTYIDGGGGYMLVNASDSTTIPGWTVADQNIAWIQSGPPTGLSGTQGNYFLDLTGIVNQKPFGAVIGTTISTVANNWYTLSFDVGRGNGEDANAVVVHAMAGAQTGTFTVSTADPGAGHIAWETFVLQFQATGSSTTITIGGTDANAGNGFIGLDNLNVSAVPEPTTMIAGALLLLPFGASTLRILRKNRMA
jgi:Protein of unknown function (DUF642)